MSFRFFLFFFLQIISWKGASFFNGGGGGGVFQFGRRGIVFQLGCPMGALVLIGGFKKVTGWGGHPPCLPPPYGLWETLSSYGTYSQHCVTNKDFFQKSFVGLLSKENRFFGVSIAVS